MNSFTSHLKPGEMPVMIPEGGRWLAGIFGWLWFGFRGEWLIAVILLALNLLLARLSVAQHNSVPLLSLMLLQGVFATDLLRYHARLRGYGEGPVVMARDEESALARLLDARPDLTRDFIGATSTAGAGF